MTLLICLPYEWDVSIDDAWLFSLILLRLVRTCVTSIAHESWSKTFLRSAVLDFEFLLFMVRWRKKINVRFTPRIFLWQTTWLKVTCRESWESCGHLAIWIHTTITQLLNSIPSLEISIRMGIEWVFSKRQYGIDFWELWHWNFPMLIIVCCNCCLPLLLELKVEVRVLWQLEWL